MVIYDILEISIINLLLTIIAIKKTPNLNWFTFHVWYCIIYEIQMNILEGQWQEQEVKIHFLRAHRFHAVHHEYQLHTYRTN